MTRLRVTNINGRVVGEVDPGKIFSLPDTKPELAVELNHSPKPVTALDSRFDITNAAEPDHIGNLTVFQRQGEELKEIATHELPAGGGDLITSPFGSEVGTPGSATYKVEHVNARGSSGKLRRGVEG